MNNIGTNIKRFRKLAGLSQYELAAKAKITRNYLSLLEGGKREPSMAKVKEISRILKIPVSILLLEINEKSQDPLDKLLMKVYEVASQHLQRNI